MASTADVQKELICPICADYFTDPKGLPCYHTFCRDCLKSVIMSQEHKRQFSCPMCRSVVPAPADMSRSEWVESFPTNHHVRSILDIVVPNIEPTCCKLCKDKDRKQKATRRCHTCSEDYCVDCARLHTLLNATKHHALEDLIPGKKYYRDPTSSQIKTQNSDPKMEYKISACFKETLSVRTDQDDEPAFITGAMFLEDDRILVADNSNCKIKLYESEGNFVTEVYYVQPFDLTLMYQTIIAATEANSIKFFQVYPNKIKMEKIYNPEWKVYIPHTIPVSNNSRGLHFSNGQFVVCSGDDLEKHVAILDADGKNRRHIWQDKGAKSNIFKEPWYCKFDDNLQDIYVSDGAGVFGCVKCMSYYGKPKWEYSCNMPRGIALIGDHIFIADWREDEIKVLTKNGEFVKTLLTRADGIRRPQAVTVNHSGDKLIVSNSPPYKSDDLLVFELEYSRTIGTTSSSTSSESCTCAIM